MHRPRRRVSVDALREATRSAVRRTSLRKVARDIGISAPGLALFLDGSVPRETTLHKIREWYFSEAATRTELSEETARAVLEMLLEPLPEERRRKVFRKVVAVMMDAHRRQGTVPPQWLLALHGDGDDGGSG
ncbi:MAG TPA: hypothetical protein VFR81_19655 [Longimicrobium sp.]|nr:hypothetical protein [Longimicrobium sp.]